LAIEFATVLPLRLPQRSDEHADVAERTGGSWQEGLPQDALEVADLLAVLWLECAEKIAGSRKVMG